MVKFGDYIRKRRFVLQEKRGKDYSLRKVAGRIGMQPSYLSRIERGTDIPPSEKKLNALAEDLDLDKDVVLAMAGKVSSDLQEIIRKRPQLFSDLIRQLKDVPDEAVIKVVREVRDGEW